MRAAAAALVVLLACSSPGDDSASDLQTPRRSARDDTDTTPRRDEKDRRPRSENDEEGQNGGAGRRDGGSDDQRNDSAPGGGGDSDDSPTAMRFPAPGNYEYHQTGYEEFCQATCNRRKLPPTQVVETRVRDRTADSAVVVTEAHPSDDRSVETAARFTTDVVLITRVESSFSFGAFDYRTAYSPKPPIESLRLPVRVGERWSGSWKARTSGDYTIAITREETVDVDGRRVTAFVIDSDMRFKGEFEGTARITVWFHPQTKTIVKTMGHLDVGSEFGTYETEFTTRLRSGPSFK